MNYRHGYHAGNFADVFKHAVLARVLVHMNAKETPYRMIDTHAGAGRYDLGGEKARATGEAASGIARLLADPPGGKPGALLAPYLDAVRKSAPRYLGSPALMQALSRPQDRMIFCEMHPDEYAALVKSIGRDRRAKAMEMDGWQALKALLPPKERRGVVLIDPPYEDPGEFRQTADAIADAIRRFATGIYLVWYPVKNRHDTDAAVRRIARAAGGVPALKLEFEIAPPKAEGSLTACGLLAINPPWKLQEECAAMLPQLSHVLAGENRGAVRVEAAE
jgi:23S rRNA (adenine2030-N6)-methyltransferase